MSRLTVMIASLIPAVICITIISILAVAFVAALPGAIDQITEQGRAVVAASVE